MAVMTAARKPYRGSRYELLSLREAAIPGGTGTTGVGATVGV
jgi:hypothetical protein